MEENDIKLKEQYPWLTNELFQQILEKEYPNKLVNVKDLIVRRALKYGENYASQMLRVSVVHEIDNDHDVKSLSFVIKASLADPAMRELMEKHSIYKKEIIMYTHIIADAERMLREIGEPTKLAPRCFGTSIEDSYLIFEDLTANGYKNTNRRTGLDINHYKTILAKIARFHAATAVLRERKDYPYLDNYLQPLYSEELDDIRTLTNIISKTVVEMTNITPGFEEVSQKLSNILDTMFDSICADCKTSADTFNVLNHGDLWANNLMFSYGDGDEPNDGVMVDYQTCYVGPAVADLAYHLFTSSNEELRDRDWDILLQYYHKILQTTLEKLGYLGKIPTLTDLHVQFLKRGSCMMIMGIFVTGMRHFEDANENTSSIFFKDDEEYREQRLSILINPRARKGLNFLIDYFSRKGFFER